MSQRGLCVRRFLGGTRRGGLCPAPRAHAAAELTRAGACKVALQIFPVGRVKAAERRLYLARHAAERSAGKPGLSPARSKAKCRENGNPNET